MAIKVEDTTSGNPYHDEGTGEFTSKDGIGEKKEELDGAGDDLDLLSEISSLKIDDDLNDLLDIFDSLVMDDDLQNLKIEKTIEEIAAESPTLRNYVEARKKKLSDKRPRLSIEDQMFLKKKMREILDNTSYASRIQMHNFLDFIKSGYYKNQFGVGHTEGYSGISSAGGGWRGEMTRTDFGTTEKDKTKWEKYGILYPTKNYMSLINGEDGAKEHYGHACILFNKEKFRGLVTYTLGDSLDYDDISPIRVEDDADEFMSDYASRLTKDKIKDCNSIVDIRNATYCCYPEAQYHLAEIPIGEYVDAICIPYSDLVSYDRNVKEAMKICREKYPNLKFISNTKEGRIKVITLDDDDNYVYSFEEYDN